MKPHRGCTAHTVHPLFLPTAMPQFRIQKYSSADEQAWNAFNERSKNGTFLFDRRYMDYHRDRFEDYSLLFFAGEKLYALLPANRKGDTLRSHGGLTYGGLIMDETATAANVVTLFEELNAWLRGEDFTKVVYSPAPWIYHRLPAEEDLYALFKVCQASLVSRSLSSTIVMNNKLRWSRDRRYGINRCRTNGVTVQRSDDYEGFWRILDDNLMACHGVHPVHTLEEIRLLRSRFPSQIILYTATQDSTLLGGTVLYVTGQTVHAQYISASPEGKRLRVIDAIYDRILNEDFNEYRYFDFGKSTEGDGTYLNENLVHQKEGFGGRGVVYDSYEWNV